MKNYRAAQLNKIEAEQKQKIIIDEDLAANSRLLTCGAGKMQEWRFTVRSEFFNLWCKT